MIALPILVINIFELVATILATIHYKKYKNTTEKYFLHILWYTLFTEAFGLFLIKFFGRNLWFMNIYGIVIYSFFTYWFYTIIKTKLHKKIVVIGGILFLSVVFYNAVFGNWKYYFYMIFTAGAISMLVYTTLFFSELLNSNEVLKLKTNLRFWIATGMLLFSVGMIPLTFFSSVFEKDWNTRLAVLMCINIILYGCYSLGFIWSKPGEKISS